MQAGSLVLRQSNVKLQEELRKTNNSYVEEKAMLQSHLSSLRLDLSQLHNDNKTCTTDGTHSRVTPSTCPENEHKRLADFDGESGRSLQLPAIKHLNLASSRTGESHSTRQTSDTARSKTLRFTGNDEVTSGHQYKPSSDWDSVDSKEESQKFIELQKNQEILRNIGRANLREKRLSLIRLPTISSAKKRNSLWDSGNNVSRPKGMSTSFEQNQTLYMEDSMDLSKRIFNIPSIKDTQRSEIHLSNTTKRPVISKRKVQFTRPRDNDRAREKDHIHRLDVSATESSSLNTTMADISLEDNTLGNITFDEDAFNKQLAAKHDDTSSTFKHPHSKRHNQTTTTTSHLQPIAESQQPGNSNHAKPLVDNNDTNDNNNNNNTKNTKTDDLNLPPIKIKTLAKRNLILHDMNNMRTSPTHFPKLRLSPDNKSFKDSDRSAGTKFSRLSEETESWKSTYVNNADAETKNKTLTEIMFAVRSRMRENEETIRFGQTPCPKDKTLSDLLLARSRNMGTPRWSDASQSPRKGKVSKRGHPTIPPTKAEKSSRRTDNTANLQGYLRKMVRQRHLGGSQHDYSPRHRPSAAANQFHKQPRMIAQHA